MASKGTGILDRVKTQTLLMIAFGGIFVSHAIDILDMDFQDLGVLEILHIMTTIAAAGAFIVLAFNRKRAK